MKRIAITVCLVVLLGALLLTQPRPSAALVAPIATSSSSVLPLATPRPLPVQDPYYRERPHKVTAHAGPYVDQYGDTIVQESVMEQPHHEPTLFQIKATPQPALQQVQTARSLTPQSCLSC